MNYRDDIEKLNKELIIAKLNDDKVMIEYYEKVIKYIKNNEADKIISPPYKIFI